jgi:hypothetical protein
MPNFRKQKPCQLDDRAKANSSCAKYNNYDRIKQLNFAIVNAAALGALPALLQRWLPDGVKVGNEYRAHNPMRSDNNLGSFSVNLNTGKWADFASGDKGGDVISLAAYLGSLNQYQAAIKLAAMLGVNHG